MSGKHVLVGYERDRRGEDALALALVAARQTGGPLTVATVRPPSWPVPGPGKVDAEWERFLDEQAEEALRTGGEVLARLGVPSGLRIDYAVAKNRGSGKGLSQIAARVGAELVVIGSSPHGARHGIAVGSTGDQLLHGSPIPVMIAPKGYAAVGRERFGRITVAYLKRPGWEQAVDFGAQLAADRRVPLRLLSVAVGQRARGKAAQLAEEATRRVVDRYESDLAEAVAAIRREGSVRASLVETEVVQGPDAERALAATDWLPGDLLVISSSETGPIRKVFMGDMSLKIIRAVPCPAVVLPRISAAQKVR